jgi:hypothetical protein
MEVNPSQPLLALVGGFLGAGKTSLILSAAAVLHSRGLRVAVVLNDQDHGLVDTRFTESRQFPAREVAGGCFCCRFSDLLDAAEQLAALAPDVIFAEPVGSCVDLSATILHPLLAHYASRFRLAPLSVLIDPGLADAVLAGRADPNVAYLFRQQLAEGDLICATKQDAYPALPAFPFPVDFQLCARTGEGVEAWLDEIMSGRRVVGSRLLSVDYAEYAAAEAALGWLNFQAEIVLCAPLSPSVLVGPLLDRLDARLTAAGIRIAHLKIFDRSSCGYVKASICSNGADPEPEGDLLAPAAFNHEFVINLRAVADPDRLLTIVEKEVARLIGTLRVRHLRAFRPAAPQPQFRYARGWAAS